MAATSLGIHQRTTFAFWVAGVERSEPSDLALLGARFITNPQKLVFLADFLIGAPGKPGG